MTAQQGLVDLTRYIEYGMSMEYMDRLLNRGISFGKDNFARWLDPCYTEVWWQCKAGWVEHSPLDVRFGTFGRDNHTGTYWDGEFTWKNTTASKNTGKWRHYDAATNSNTSFFILPLQNNKEVTARDWDNYIGNKNGRSEIWDSLKKSRQHNLKLANPVKSNSHTYNLTKHNWNNEYKLYLDFSNISKDDITITPVDKSFKFTHISPTYESASVGQGSSVTFDIIPNLLPDVELKYTSKNELRQTTINGFDSTSTNSRSTSLSIETEVKAEMTQKVSAGIEKGPVKVGSETTTKVSAGIKSAAGLKNAWSSAKKINFSDSEAEFSSTQRDLKIRLPITQAKPNSDGSYGMNTLVWGGKTLNDVQPDDEVVTFWPGQEYRAEIITYNSENDTIATGDFKISGRAGYLQDNRNYKLNLPAAEAMHYAKKYKAYEQFGNPTDPLDPNNTYSLTSDDRDKIDFQGKTKFSTTFMTNFKIKYFKNGDVIDYQQPSPVLNNALVDKYGVIDVFDLGLVDHDVLSTGIGSALALENSDAKLKIINGSKGGQGYIEASSKGKHKFLNHRESFLYGNEKTDVLKFADPYYSDNYLHTKGGDDHVRTKASQNANLGTGNDIYIINGENTSHIIKFGDGHDKLVINRVKNNYFKIADFSYVDDVIKFGPSVDKDKISVSVRSPKNSDDIAGAKIVFKHKDDIIGEAYIQHDQLADTALIDPEAQLELGFINSDVFNWNVLLKWSETGTLPSPRKVYEKLVVNGDMYAQETNSASDWGIWDNKQRSEVLHSAIYPLLKKQTKTQDIEKVLNSLPNDTIKDYSLDMVADSIFPLLPAMDWA
jgi:hypothetical protein